MSADALNPAQALGPARLLGHAGLIPFLVALLARGGSGDWLPWAPATLFIAYGAVIASFMAGSLWGRALQRGTASLRWLLGSNALALGGWLALWWQQSSQTAALLLLAAVFAMLLVLEQWRLPPAAALPGATLEAGYRRLRQRLTAFVLLLHGAMIASLHGWGA